MTNQKPEAENQKSLPDFKKEFMYKWEVILQDVDKHRIPVKFIKKLILKLEGKKQQTINVVKLFTQGLEEEQIELAISKKIHELDDEIVSIEFVLNVEAIADTVQPETDKLLYKL